MVFQGSARGVRPTSGGTDRIAYCERVPSTGVSIVFMHDKKKNEVSVPRAQEAFPTEPAVEQSQLDLACPA